MVNWDFARQTGFSRAAKAMIAILTGVLWACSPDAAPSPGEWRLAFGDKDKGRIATCRLDGSGPELLTYIPVHIDELLAWPGLDDGPLRWLQCRRNSVQRR